MKDDPKSPAARKRNQAEPRRCAFHGAGRLIAAAALALAVMGCKKDEQAAAGGRKTGPPPVQVSTIGARRGDIAIYVNALGLATPVSTVSIRSRVDGQLISVNYREGQEVREKDPLVEIDAGPYQAALTQAEGQAARDAALLENAKLDLRRYQDAFARDAVPKQQLDTQMALVRQFEGTVRYDQGLVDNAKVQLAYCHITAPISGRVGLRLVDPGNIVRSSDANPLLVITQLKPITVIFSVGEDDLPRIQAQMKTGNPLTVEAYDRAQLAKLATGTLLTVDNQIDTSTGKVKLKAQFANDDALLFANQFVNVHLLVDTKRDVVLLPNPTIQHNAQSAFVYLLKPDQTVAIQTITVGAFDENESEVDGVKTDDIIVSDNFSRLYDGAKVVPRAPRDGQKSKGPHPPKAPQ